MDLNVIHGQARQVLDARAWRSWEAGIGLPLRLGHGRDRALRLALDGRQIALPSGSVGAGEEQRGAPGLGLGRIQCGIGRDRRLQ